MRKRRLALKNKFCGKSDFPRFSQKSKFLAVFFIAAIFIFFGSDIKEVLSAAETKWADTHITGTITTPNNALGATNGTWAGDVNANVSATSRYSMENPSGGLSGTQTINVVARKGSNSGTPTVTINLYENGALVQEIVAATSITSTTGQTLVGTFNGAVITAGSDVEIEIVIVGAGGSPSVRNSAQIDSIEWAVQYSAATTTLSTGTNPGNSTIAPGGAITSVNGFTLTTNTGTDAITSITVNLSTNSGVGTLTITDGADTVLGSVGGGTGAGIVTGSNAISITSTNATTGGTAFKVKVTPLSHANMPAPDGGAYAITGVVTDWAGSNTKAGQASDTSSTVTIDNDSPAGTTGAGATSGESGQSAVSWTAPGDGDFQQVYIYCKTSSMISGEAPTEGTDPTVDGTACDGTARMKYKGAASPQTITNLANGTIYYFRIYARDTNGNFTAYSATQEVTGTPSAPAGPDATSFTNDGEAGLTDGGRIGQQITVSGTAFGGACSSPDTVAKIGTYEVPCASVSVWNSTTITFTIPAAVTVYGGAGTSGLIVRSAGTDDATPLDFYVYPDITSTSPTPVVGAKEGDTVTITGTRFGSAGGTLVFQNCAGGDVDATPTGANWTDTSLAVTVPSGIADNDDACDIKITRAAGSGSKTDISNNTADNLGTFVILPSITTFGTCTGCGTNSAREYAAADTDGLVRVIGNHFGTSQGVNGKMEFTGGFGVIPASIHTGADGACTIGGWDSSGTSICIEVPVSISNSVYSGTVTVTRNDNKTHEFTDTAFSILPRITGNSPTSGSSGDVIQILGNHFCTTGTCPTSPNRSSASDNILFGATQAADGDFVGQSGGAGACNGAGAAWTHTEICVKVPTGTPTGSQPTKVTSNTKLSNTSTFTVTSNTPSDPTALGQFKDSGFTLPITTGSYASGTPIYLKQTMEVPGISGGTLYPQFEYQLTGTAFLCGAGACGSAVEGTGSAGPGPATGSKSITPADGNYHWQARTRHNKGGSDYYSGWVSYGGNNDPNDADFVIDTTAPTITTTPTATNVLSNSATITWGTSGETSTSQVQYNKTGTFGACAGDCTTLDTNLVNNHSVNLSNLDSGTTYYYRVRSKDTAGNEVVSTNYQFPTSGVTNPGKTVIFHAMDKTGVVSATNIASSTFSVLLPETSSSIKSAFIELNGVTAAAGTNSFDVWLNNQATTTYSISTAAAGTTFRAIYRVNASDLYINDSPSINVLYIMPSLDTYIAGAKVFVTFSYSP